MAIREVDEAVSGAPERRPTAVEQLEMKKAERTAAQSALAQARADLNVDQIMNQQQRVAVLDDLLPVLEVEAQKEIEADARVQAANRFVGIRRALGSNRSAIDEAEVRLRDLLKQLVNTVERVNRHAWDAERLRREAEALIDRFDLQGEAVVMPVSPTERGLDMRLPKLVDLTQIMMNAFRPVIENHDHFGWQRRTYSEVEGTQAGEIIARVGPKPWPSVTPEQQEFIEQQKKRAEEQRKRNAEGWAEAGPVPPESRFPLGNAI